MEEGGQLFRGQSFHLAMLHFWQSAGVSGIACDKPLFNGQLESGRDDLVDITDSFGAETLRLFFAFDSFYPAVCQQGLVELL